MGQKSKRKHRPADYPESPGPALPIPWEMGWLTNWRPLSGSSIQMTKSQVRYRVEMYGVRYPRSPLWSEDVSRYESRSTRRGLIMRSMHKGKSTKIKFNKLLVELTLYYFLPSILRQWKSHCLDTDILWTKSVLKINTNWDFLVVFFGFHTWSGWLCDLFPERENSYREFFNSFFE